MSRALNLLYVEDNEDDVLLLRRALRDTDFAGNLITVDDGSKATNYLSGAEPFTDRKTHPLPDVIISDLKMRKVGGLEFLNWMQTRPETSGIPVFILSTSQLKEDASRATQAGARGYFVKPLSIEEWRERAKEMVAAMQRIVIT